MVNQRETERKTPREPQWSAVQGTAVLLLCRLFVFFCSHSAYTAAQAKGMFVAVIIQAALVIPLLHFRQYLQIPAALLWLYRVFALLWAARLTAALYTLLIQLQAPHPLLILALLGASLLYTAAMPQAATARAATVLLLIACIGFVLLPISGFSTARFIYLYTPANAADAFFAEWSSCGELAVLPLIWLRQTDRPLTAPRTTCAWLLGRGVILPLVVLFGAMQNGRLLAWEGSPFFLLLARTPLSEALRTDGFWMLLAVGCAVLGITFFLQIAKPPLHARLSACCCTGIPLLAVTLLYIAAPSAARGFGIAAPLLGIVLPWATVCKNLLLKRRFAV